MEKEIFGYKGYIINLETGVVHNPSGRELKQSKTFNGYYTVTIEGKRRKVHRLVLMTATNCSGEGLQVNHIDGNKANNNLNNLEWCTCKENIEHSNITGLNKHINKVVRKDRKLSDEEVLEIRKLLSEGKSSKEITQLCPKANYKNIYAIKHNLSYKLIQDNTEVN